MPRRRVRTSYFFFIIYNRSCPSQDVSCEKGKLVFFSTMVVLSIVGSNTIARASSTWHAQKDGFPWGKRWVKTAAILIWFQSYRINPTNMTKQCAQYRIVSNRAEILRDRETNQDSRWALAAANVMARRENGPTKCSFIYGLVLKTLCFFYMIMVRCVAEKRGSNLSLLSMEVHWGQLFASYV